VAGSARPFTLNYISQPSTFLVTCAISSWICFLLCARYTHATPLSYFYARCVETKPGSSERATEVNRRYELIECWMV
jgi:hypothetical protein